MTQIAIPPILISASPKSGSQFILRALADMLQVEQLWIASPTFMSQGIDLRQLYKLKQGGIGKAHFLPTKFNINAVERHFAKILIHTRHPGQAVLSWVHNLDRLHAGRHEHGNQIALDTVSDWVPDTYYDWDFHKRLDFQIEQFVPRLVNWAVQWLDYVESPGAKVDVLMTDYRDLHADNSAYLDKVMSFFGVPADAILYSDAPEPERYPNWRRGDVDEWRSVLTPPQVELTQSQITSRLRQAFGWE